MYHLCAAGGKESLDQLCLDITVISATRSSPVLAPSVAMVNAPVRQKQFLADTATLSTFSKSWTI